MESVILSLQDPVKSCLLKRNLPDNGIRFDGHETLNPTSFPGWPSFGDLLCHGGSKTLVGLSFQVPDEFRASAQELAKKLSPRLVEFRELDSQSELGAYAGQSHRFWLEVKWSAVQPDRLIEVQTCDVLWYPKAGPEHDRFPIALGIEHLEYLVESADYDLDVPFIFPFPAMKIEFLND